MALSVGTRLGPYQIVSAIGAGGMGEVYRATDTTLKREVAIKVLPEAVVQRASVGENPSDVHEAPYPSSVDYGVLGGMRRC